MLRIFLRTAAVTVSLLLFVVITTTAARAATTEHEALIKQINALIELIGTLQTKLLSQQANAVIPDNLVEGMSGESVRKIQMVLAQDDTIYPEGDITGYFGPRTTAAIKRFQNRQRFAETGLLDDDTRSQLRMFIGMMEKNQNITGYLRSGGLYSASTPAGVGETKVGEEVDRIASILKTAPTVAKRFYTREGSYYEFCGSSDFSELEKAVGGTLGCRADEERYKIETLLYSNKWAYCVDYTGHNGAIASRMSDPLNASWAALTCELTNVPGDFSQRYETESMLKKATATLTEVESYSVATFPTAFKDQLTSHLTKSRSALAKAEKYFADDLYMEAYREAERAYKEAAAASQLFKG